MTRDLEGWRRRFELSSALDDLIGDQSALHQETQDIGRGTLCSARESLTPQQQADLERLAERQRRLAERLASLDAATTSSPSGGRRSEDAVSSSSSPGTPAPAHPESLTKMQAATESLRRNEIPRRLRRRSRSAGFAKLGRQTRRFHRPTIHNSVSMNCGNASRKSILCVNSRSN